MDEGQDKEGQILSNTYGSPRYNKFLQNLGRLVRLKGNSIFMLFYYFILFYFMFSTPTFLF